MQTTATREIANQSERLRNESISLVNLLMGIEAPGGSRIDLQSTIPGASTSIAEMNARIQGLCVLAESVATVASDKLLLVPSNHLAGLSQELARVFAAIQGISQTVDAIRNSEGGLESIDPLALVLRSRNSNVSLGELLVDSERHVDAALDRVHRISAITNPPGHTAFSAATESSVKFIEQLSQHASNLGRMATESAQDRRAVLAATKAIGEREAQINASADEVEKSLSLVRTKKDQVEELLKNATDIATTASNLKTQIDSYQTKFTEFDQKIADRNADFVAGQTSQKALIDELTVQSQTAQTIITNAKVALQWGTAEGLAKSFATSADELNQPLEKATDALHLSFIILAVWVVLVFLIPQLIDPSLAILRVPENLEGVSAFAYLLSAVAIRLVIVSPALLFTLFANRRYRAIFSARELYTFKKTVAAAIPGFKEQAAARDADEHVKAMTAAAFERLLFNPKDSHPDPLESQQNFGILSRWLVRIIRRAFEDAKPAAK